MTTTLTNAQTQTETPRIIYKITQTNAPNSKFIYIGCTSNLNTRWAVHRYHARANKTAMPLHEVMRSNGIDNFQITEIDRVPEPESFIREQQYVQLYIYKGWDVCNARLVQFGLPSNYMLAKYEQLEPQAVEQAALTQEQTEPIMIQCTRCHMTKSFHDFVKLCGCPIFSLTENKNHYSRLCVQCIDLETKQCTRCHETKPAKANFNLQRKYSGGSKLVYQSICKQCKRVEMKARYVPVALRAARAALNQNAIVAGST